MKLPKKKKVKSSKPTAERPDRIEGEAIDTYSEDVPDPPKTHPTAPDQPPKQNHRIQNNSKENDDDDDDENDENDDDDQKDVQKKRRRKRKRKRKTDPPEDDNDDDDDNDVAPPSQLGPEVTPAEQNHHDLEEELSRTLYMEGIPYDATADQVRQSLVEHLHKMMEKQEGGVVAQDDLDSAEATEDFLIVDCRLPVWPDSGRLRGFGHVVLATTALRDQLYAQSGQVYVQQRYLSFQPAHQQTNHQGAAHTPSTSSSTIPSKTIVLHNLSYDATEEDIKAVMQKFGALTKGGVRLVRHSANQRSKGFAYVEFVDLASAQRVMQQLPAAALVIRGRPCRPDYDHGRVRGSFRTAEGRLWQKEYHRPGPTGPRNRGGATR